jgi:hypothetical protein
MIYDESIGINDFPTRSDLIAEGHLVLLARREVVR